MLHSSNTAGNQWYYEGDELPGEVAQSITVTESGTYAVITTIQGCSSQISDNYSLIITSIEKANGQESILYPNPVVDEVQVNLNSFNAGVPVDIQVFDIQGRPVQRFVGIGRTLTELDLAHLPKGVYLLRMSDYGKTVSRKFVKE